MRENYSVASVFLILEQGQVSICLTPYEVYQICLFFVPIQEIIDCSNCIKKKTDLPLISPFDCDDISSARIVSNLQAMR